MSGVEIQVTLCTQENRGDHASDVRLAATAPPDETVEHLLLRLMRAGEHAQKWRTPEPPSAWIELRYVDGTLPEKPATPATPNPADPWGAAS